VLQDPAEVREWAGVGSLVLVDDPWSHIAHAVEETAQGRVWISDGVVPFLAAAVSGRSEVADVVPVPRQLLTPTEDETLKLVLEGMSNSDIAVVRSVSLSTVKSCVRTVLGKYGCASRQQLIALFLSSGYRPTEVISARFG
jgi:DNA-binding NarL/FixJ family response regulator